MKEANIRNTIILKGTDKDTRLWNNPTGMAYRGKLVGNGTLVEAVPIKYGLAVGSSDIIGIKRVKVTEDMIGNELGVFVALEVKTDKGELRPEQRVFLDIVGSLGGISGVVRSVDEAKEVLNG
jgi:hypothetical protein